MPNYNKKTKLVILFFFIFLLGYLFPFSYSSGFNNRFISFIPNLEGFNVWNVIEVVSNGSNEESRFVSIAVDNEGNVHLAYIQHVPPYHHLLYKCRSAVTGTWGQIEAVHAPGDHALDPSLDIDQDFNVHLTWKVGSGCTNTIYYRKRYSNTGIWGSIETVASGDSRYPCLSVDTNGNVYALYVMGGWPDWDLYCRTRSAGGLWSSSELVSSESTAQSNEGFVKVDNEGNVHVCWTDITNYMGSSDDSDIFYKVKNATTGSWTTTEVVSNQISTNGKESTLYVDSNKMVHFTWEDTSDHNIYYRSKDLMTGIWSTTEQVSTEIGGQSLLPSIVVNNSIHIVWMDSFNYAGSGSDFDIFYKYKDSNTGNWSSTEVISNPCNSYSYQPCLAIDKNSNLHVAWEDATDYNGAGTDLDIFYTFKILGTTGANPTNPFLYLENPIIIIIFIIIMVGAVATGSVIIIRVVPSKIKNQRLENHKEFILTNKKPISLARVDKIFKVPSGESSKNLKLLLKKRQVEGVIYQGDKYFIPASFIDEIERQLGTASSPKKVEYKDQIPIPIFQVNQIYLFDKYRNYDFSPELFKAIINYLIETQVIIGYNDKDKLFLLRGFGLRALFTNVKGFDLEFLAQNFQEIEKWGVEILKFKSIYKRIPNEEEAEDVGIPGELVPLIYSFIQIQIIKPLQDYLSKSEKEYYDKLSLITIKKLQALDLDLSLDNLVLYANLGIKDAKIVQFLFNKQLKEEFKIDWPLSTKELEIYDKLSNKLFALIKNKPELRNGNNLEGLKIMLELGITMEKLQFLLEFVKKVTSEPFIMKFEYFGSDDLKIYENLAKSILKNSEDLLTFNLTKIATDLGIGIYTARIAVAYYEWILHDYEPKSISLFLQREKKEFGLKVREVLNYLKISQNELSLLNLIKDLNFGLKEAYDFLSLYQQILAEKKDFDKLLTSHKKIIKQNADKIQRLIKQKGKSEINLDDLILETDIFLSDLWNALLYIKDTGLIDLKIKTTKPKISTENIDIKISHFNLN